ncbi:MAG: hypothetical protein A3G34_13130 [Candidatus Lindowbacteria bacterium RIFCSPLOWO2_12_FULL_62_27]|nr:MAG: hypothetical protein A3I06_14920 [Candidatus Lindowbacteria bacterium RIFCSPLOWO2_02_FULL_62_12]OGH62528.1 MAG: hypothetical protein A3G34_13130 [Candidatus Lindowbacteria bacterium RIFCSPLOWO2_12_FULL_62_27]
MSVQRLDPKPDVIVVKATVYGARERVETRLILDTGAATTLIDPDILLVAGYDPAKAVRRQAMTTASGHAYAPLLAVRRLVVLGHAVGTIDVVAHSLPPNVPVRGLLGMNFLRHFNLHLEFPARRLRMEGGRS